MANLLGPSLIFDAVADDYDQTRVIPPDVLDDIVRLCAEQAHLSHGGLLLDAGVGTGRFAQSLSPLYPEQIVGIDLSWPMLAHARRKSAHAGHSIALACGDLQRLPFGSGTFRAVLMVHILHLIEHWSVVLGEAKRVLEPHEGVLLLGSEQGGRGLLIDFYWQQARANNLLRRSMGADRDEVLRRLRRDGAKVQLVSAPYMSWKRIIKVGDTLEALRRRTYSQIWGVPDDLHEKIMASVTHFAEQTFPSLESTEQIDMRFVLHAVRWP